MAGFEEDPFLKSGEITADFHWSGIFPRGINELNIIARISVVPGRICISKKDDCPSGFCEYFDFSFEPIFNNV